MRRASPNPPSSLRSRQLRSVSIPCSEITAARRSVPSKPRSPRQPPPDLILKRAALVDDLVSEVPAAWPSSLRPSSPIYSTRATRPASARSSSPSRRATEPTRRVAAPEPGPRPPARHPRLRGRRRPDRDPAALVRLPPRSRRSSRARRRRSSRSSRATIGPTSSGEIFEDDRQAILAASEVDTAREVRALLAHDADTAGGLMRTEYVSLVSDADGVVGDRSDPAFGGRLRGLCDPVSLRSRRCGDASRGSSRCGRSCSRGGMRDSPI